MERRHQRAALAAVLTVGIATVLALLWTRGRGAPAVLPAGETPDAPLARPEPSMQGEPALRRAVELEPQAQAPRAPAPRDEVDESWLVATPPGVVEVQVYAGDAPARGALVELLPEDVGAFQYGEPVDALGQALDAPRWLSRTTDELGLVRWTELAPGRPGLRVTLANGARALRHAELWEGKPSSRVVVRFGTSSVVGTVHDGDGAPLAGAHIWSDQTPHGWGNDVHRWTVSAGDGAYRFDGLVEGFTQVADAAPGPGRRARFELGASERRRVDLGTGAGAVTWRGRLRLPSGAPLAEPLGFVLDEVDRGWQETLQSGRDGTFQLVLQPGLYRADLYPFSGKTELARVEVGLRDFTRDLVLPAPCLRLVVLRPWSATESAGNADEVSVQIVPLGEGPAPGHGFTTQGSRLFLAGVPAGRYEVSVHAYRITGFGDGPLPLVIEPGQELVELTLQATRKER